MVLLSYILKLDRVLPFYSQFLYLIGVHNFCSAKVLNKKVNNPNSYRDKKERYYLPARLAHARRYFEPTHLGYILVTTVHNICFWLLTPTPPTFV